MSLWEIVTVLVGMPADTEKYKNEPWRPDHKTSSPPRPLASRRVDALTQPPTLQTSQNLQKQSPRGRVYPPPTPSRTVRLAVLQPVLD